MITKIKNRKREHNIHTEIEEIVETNLDSRDYQASVKQYRIKSKLTSQMVGEQIYESYKYDPETMICELESKKMLVEFWKLLKTKLSPIDLAYLMKYIEYNNNSLATATALGIHNMIILRSLERVRKAKDEVVAEMGLTEDELLYCFRPQINSYITQSASHIGYPSEAYMNLPARRSWTVKYGTKRFCTQARCLIPEFLEESNLKCTYCTICNEGYKCSRKDVYPLNAEPTEAIKANIERLEQCVKNFWENHNEQDYAHLMRVNKLQ